MRKDGAPTITRRHFLAAAMGATLAGLCGCSPSKTDSAVLTWGQPDVRDGSFQRPRAIGVCNGEVYVVDVTGRIQVFSTNGDFRRRWSTPAHENGTPTSVTLASDGNILVPDTHYSQILKYTSQGQLIEKWGSYGSGPDQFIYPTDLVQVPDGTCFISEYGEGAERVHVFDAQRRFLRQWGGFGEAPGQFNRAMAIDIDAQGLLYVGDVGNHRVQCFDAQGKLLRVIGEPGEEPGQIKYPYSIACAPDGSILVADYGTHRISRFRPTGEFIGCFGRPGRAPGQFNGPRGVAVSPNGLVFVADTDNHRVQRFPLEKVT